MNQIRVTIRGQHKPVPKLHQPRGSAARHTPETMLVKYTKVSDGAEFADCTVDEAPSGWAFDTIHVYPDATGTVPDKGWAWMKATTEGGRWYPFVPEVLREIVFQIASFDPASRTVLGDIVGWDSGFDWTDAPDLLGDPSLPLRVVEIYDYLGCIFDEPSSELFDRMGFARYMNYVADGYTQGPRWIAFELCCKTPTCEV